MKIIPHDFISHDLKMITWYKNISTNVGLYGTSKRFKLCLAEDGQQF